MRVNIRQEEFVDRDLNVKQKPG